MSFIYDLSATWNSVGTTYNGIKLNATNGLGGAPVASAASRLINLLNNSTSVFSVDLDGVINAAFIQDLLNASTISLQEKLEQRVTIEDFGGVGDGTTNNYSAITKALAALFLDPKELIFGPGDYLVTSPSGVGTVFGVNNSLRMRGSGKFVTRLIHVPPDNGFYGLFNCNVSNFEMVDMQVVNSIPAGGSGHMFLPCTNFYLRDSIFNGGVTDNGVSQTVNISLCLNTPESGTQNNVNLVGCEFTQLTDTWQKTNTSIATNETIRVTGCTFHSNYTTDMSLNSPVGIMTDVLICDNIFYNSAGGRLGNADTFYIALANVKNFVIANNTLLDEINSGIHIEDDSDNGVVANNNVHVEGHGIVILNNTGGTEHFPDNVIVANNTIRYAGTPKTVGSKGIWIIDLSVTTVNNSLIITDNSVYDFETGIEDFSGTNDLIYVHHNYVQNTTYGIGNFSVSRSVRENIVADSTYYAYCTAGGIIHDARVINCTNLALVTGRPAVFNGISWRYNTFAVGGSASVDKTYWPLGLNDYMAGTLTIVGNMSGAATSTTLHAYNTTWDGSVFQLSLIMPVISPGSLATTTTRTGSLLNVSAFNADGVSRDVTFDVNLNGMVEVNPTFSATTGTAVGFLYLNRAAFNTTTDPGAGSIIVEKALINKSYTLASLPTPASMGAGARMYITDATAPALAVTVSGGGAKGLVVYSNGANWLCG